MTKAVFLDQDGTLIHDVPRNADPRRIELLKGVREACARLYGAGYRLIVVTDHADVARGLGADSALAGVEARLRHLVGVSLTDFLYCPHAEGDARGCSRPLTGLLQQAARRHGIDLAASWMIGGTLNDVEAGSRAGCRTILIDSGGETEWRGSDHRVPDFILPDMVHAAAAIMRPRRQAA